MNMQPAKSFDVVGLGLSSDTYKNLDAFIYYLITGKKETGINSSFGQSQVRTPRLESKIMEEIILCAKDIVQDFQRNGISIDPATLPIVIHHPSPVSEVDLISQAEKESDAISRELGFQPIISFVMHAPFEEAIVKLLEDGIWENNDQCIFISTFSYSDDNDEDKVLDAAVGLSLSKVTIASRNACQVSLLENQLASSLENEINLKEIENTSPHAKDIIAFPVFQLIGAILEIKRKSWFTLLNSSLEEKTKETKTVGKLIRPWFLSEYETTRRQILRIGENSFLELCREDKLNKVNFNSFNAFHQFLLPVSFDDAKSAESMIEDLIARLAQSHDCASIALEAIKRSLNGHGNSYNLGVLGGSSDELISELERAKSGIVNSINTGKDWQTPNGSFFTPKPLGNKAKVAFVYPGAFNTYVGMGSEIFFLFPDLFKQLEAISEDPARSINADIIFPEDQNEENNARLQNELFENPTYMISSGVCFSFLYTKLLREYFDLEPSASFGYSLGENSMMFAMDIWSQADAMRTSLEVSPIFHSRVSGDQLAIREFWGLQNPEQGKQPSSIWANYVIMAPKEKVENAIEDKKKVFITHVNTDRQVVIGGEKDACKKVIDFLKCMHLQAPYHHAIHCAPVDSEFDGFRRLHDWPIECISEVPVYSAAKYEPLEMDSDAVAESFATMLTNPIDFPGLVNKTYQDGARVFIELGAGSNCSKWISAILKDKPHLSISINQVNVSDHVSILRMLARLISHHIPVNLEYFEGTGNG